MFWNRNVPGFCASRGQRSETLKVSWCGLEGQCLFSMWWVGWSYLGLGCDQISWSCKVNEGVKLWFEKKVENFSKFFWLPFEIYRVCFFGPIHCKCAKSFSFPRFSDVKTHVRGWKSDFNGCCVASGFAARCCWCALAAVLGWCWFFFFFHWWCWAQQRDFFQNELSLAELAVGEQHRVFFFYCKQASKQAGKQGKWLWCGWASSTW